MDRCDDHTAWLIINFFKHHRHWLYMYKLNIKSSQQSFHTASGYWVRLFYMKIDVFFIKIILYLVNQGVKTVSVIYVTMNIEQKMNVLSSKALWFNISLDSTSFFLNSSNGCCIEWRVLAWFKRTFYNFPIVSTWLDNLVVIRDYLQQINMHLFSGLSQINLLYIKAHKSYFIFAWFNARHAATYSMS